MSKLLSIKIIALVVIYALFTFANIAVLAKDDWIGNPNKIESPDNPYLKLCERNVDKYLSSFETTPDEWCAFWFSWAYTNPNSTRKNSIDMKNKFISAMNTLCDKLEKAPNVLWTQTIGLEAAYVTRGKVEDVLTKKWLKQLKPSNDLMLRNIALEKGHWTNSAPNAMNQTVLVLHLMSVLYNEPAYEKKSKELLARVLQMQEADGAFRYLERSGPSGDYFNFDMAWLGRYYSLTQNPDVKQAIINAQTYVLEVTQNGVFEGASSPWWKQNWNAGGPLHAPDIVAGLTGSETAKGLAESRMALLQPYSYTAYSLPYWRGDIKGIAALPNLLKYSTNYDGTIMRTGSEISIFPWKAYTKTGVGYGISTGRKFYWFDGWIKAVALPAMEKGAVDPFPQSWPAISSDGIVMPDDLKKTQSYVGEDFMVRTLSFEAMRVYYAIANLDIPQKHGWVNSQVFYSDKNGIAGWLLLEPQKEQTIIFSPKGYIESGLDYTSLNEKNKFLAGEVEVNVFGDKIRDTRITKNKLFVDFNNDGERIYKIGEKFSYGFSLGMKGKNLYEVKQLEEYPIMAIELSFKKQPQKVVISNPTATEQTYKNSQLSGRKFYEQSDKVGKAKEGQIWKGEMTLKPYQVIVVDINDVVKEEAKEISFKDTSAHWAESTINNMAKLGFVKGNENGEANPDFKITKAEFISLISRILNLKPTDYEPSSVSDIAGNKWYSNDIARAMYVDIIPKEIISDGKLKPLNYITREEMAAIVAKAYIRARGNPFYIDKEKLNIVDMSDVSEWATDSIKMLDSIDMLKGDNENKFNPKNSLTRAEAITILERFLNCN